MTPAFVIAIGMTGALAPLVAWLVLARLARRAAPPDLRSQRWVRVGAFAALGPLLLWSVGVLSWMIGPHWP